jgi:hypothetical protein
MKKIKRLKRMRILIMKIFLKESARGLFSLRTGRIGILRVQASLRECEIFNKKFFIFFFCLPYVDEQKN